MTITEAHERGLREACCPMSEGGCWVDDTNRRRIKIGSPIRCSVPCQSAEKAVNITAYLAAMEAEGQGNATIAEINAALAAHSGEEG